IPAFAVQNELVHFAFLTLQADLLAPGKLHAQGLGGALVRVHGAKLGLLVRRALHFALLLLTGAGHEPPYQNFTMNEEVIIEYCSRGWQQKRLVLWSLLIRGTRDTLHQVFVAGRDRSLSLPRKQFLPFVFADVAVRSELQFRTLS